MRAGALAGLGLLGACASAPGPRALDVAIETLGPRIAPPNGAVRASGFGVVSAEPGVVALEVFVAGSSVPVLGETSRDGAALRFEPRFPFEAGVGYRVRLSAGGREIADVRWELPHEVAASATRVASVAPAHGVLPANLLKLYVTFSGPMRRGEAYRHVALEHPDGRPAEGVFLQLDPELWDPDARRLTLLFDPGRIKRGLALRDELGPTLIEGQDYVLRIESGWRDAAGAPLAADHELRFRAGPPDRTAPSVDRWRLGAPAAGTREPLVVTFDEPLDRALLERVVRVVDAITRFPVPGEVEVAPGEAEWRFTPESAWRAGPHALVADAILEDRSGNSLGRAFETIAGASAPERTDAPAVRAFEVR